MNKANNFSKNTLFFYGIFRFFISLSVFVFILLENKAITNLHLTIFTTYLLFNIFSMLWYLKVLHDKRLLMFFLIDTLFICVVLYFASGNYRFIINNLLIINATVANIVLVGQFGYLISMLSAVAIITDFLLSGFAKYELLLIVAMQIVFCFGISIIMQKLHSSFLQQIQITIKARENLEELSTINSIILQNMQQGLILLDKNLDILYANTSSEIIFNKDIKKYNLLNLHSGLFKLHKIYLKEIYYENLITINSREYKVVFENFITNNKEMHLILIDDAVHMKQQAQNLKLMSLGSLTSSISHEIRNPLNAILQASEILNEITTAPDEKKLSNIIVIQVNRINSVIETVLSISKNNTGSFKSHNLDLFLNNVIKIAKQELSEQLNITITPSNSTDFAIFDDKQMLQVFLNIIKNSYRHAYNNNYLKPVNISKNKHQITIADLGPGIDNKNLDKIFEPFFTTSKDGFGIGLYMSNEICRQNFCILEYQKNKKTSSFIISFKKFT